MACPEPTADLRSSTACRGGRSPCALKTKWDIPIWALAYVPMPTPLNSPIYATLRALLIQAREDAGLTQAEVAKRLRRVQSFVSKYELGERRLDVADFIAVCNCLGVDPADVLRKASQGDG